MSERHQLEDTSEGFRVRLPYDKSRLLEVMCHGSTAKKCEDARKAIAAAKAKKDATEQKK